MTLTTTDHRSIECKFITFAEQSEVPQVELENLITFYNVKEGDKVVEIHGWDNSISYEAIDVLNYITV